MRKNKIWALIGKQSVLRWIFIPIFTSIVILACSHIVINHENSKVQTIKLNPTSCHVVKHEMGETCVPHNPQRIVVLAHTTLANLLALGVKPIGILGADLPPYLQQAKDIQVVGEGWEADLEKILLLKPDLIIAKGYHSPIYNTLSQIAPTVILKWSGTPSWKEHLEDVAQVLNKTDKAKLLMRNYHQRLEEFQMKMGDRLKNLHISYIDILVGYIWCDVKNSFAGTILADAGLQRPSAQEIVTKGGYITFGLETMPMDADGDVIFTSHWMDEDGAKALKRNQNHSLWRKLKAVQQNQVYVVNRHFWRGSNILAAHKVIDDLFNYLVDGKS